MVVLSKRRCSAAALQARTSQINRNVLHRVFSAGLSPSRNSQILAGRLTPGPTAISLHRALLHGAKLQLNSNLNPIAPRSCKLFSLQVFVVVPRTEFRPHYPALRSTPLVQDQQAVHASLRWLAIGQIDPWIKATGIALAPRSGHPSRAVIDGSILHLPKRPPLNLWMMAGSVELK